MSVPKLVVTGANGFIGSTILATPRLCEVERIGLVRPGRERPIEAPVSWRSASSWTYDALMPALEGVEIVIHAAAIVHRPKAPEEEYARFNVEGTRALLLACRAQGVRRFVFLSSIKVYGEEPLGVIDEATPVAPEQFYAKAKLAAEELALEHSGTSFSVAALRLCPVYGRGDKGNVRKMIAAIHGLRFALPGRGDNQKSIVHVSTVAEAAAAAALGTAGGVFVVADSVAPTMAELADTIARVLHRPRPLRLPLRLVELGASTIERAFGLAGRHAPVTRELLRKLVAPTVFSPAKLERTFRLSCHVELEPSIADEVAWLRQQRLL